jgi:hypothetical protein
MKFLLFNLMFLLIGCGIQQNDILEGTPMFKDVDAEILPYFITFSNITGVSPNYITAGFTALEGRIAGECIIGDGYREIRINNAGWSGLSDNQKQQLISHELGHCALNLGHINQCADGTTAPDGTETSCNNGLTMPLSIMNWMMFNKVQANNITPDYYNALKLNKYEGE